MGALGATLDRIGRFISPGTAVLVLLLFLLPFASVSCSSAATSSLSSLPGATSDPSVTDCLNKMGTYSGYTVAFGGDASINSNCNKASSAAATGTASPSKPLQGGDLHIGLSITMVLALILVLVAGVVGFLQIPFRGAITAGASLLALIFVIVGEGGVKDAVTKAINNSAGSGGAFASSDTSGLATGPASQYFNVNSEIGYTLVLVVLILLLLYNLATFILTMLPSPSAAPGWSPPATPPAGGGMPGPMPPASPPPPAGPPPGPPA